MACVGKKNASNTLTKRFQESRYAYNGFLLCALKLEMYSERESTQRKKSQVGTQTKVSAKIPL